MGSRIFRLPNLTTVKYCAIVTEIGSTMALPPTGSTITMSNIRNYFVAGGFASSYTISVLGTYIGISAGSLISMSSSFGGYYFPIPD